MAAISLSLFDEETASSLLPSIWKLFLVSSFEEFLWAMGDEMMMPYIQNQFAKQQPMGGFHRRAMDYFRKYMIVGGMPQAVEAYLEHNNPKGDKLIRLK